MYKKNNKVQSSHYKKSYIRNVKLNTSLLILDFGGTKREFYLLWIIITHLVLFLGHEQYIKLLKLPWHKKRNRVDLELKRVSIKVHTGKIYNKWVQYYLSKEKMQ